jgi:hypothetical protein
MAGYCCLRLTAEVGYPLNSGLLLCAEVLTKCNVVVGNTLNGYSSLPVDRWNVILDSA